MLCHVVVSNPADMFTLQGAFLSQHSQIVMLLIRYAIDRSLPFLLGINQTPLAMLGRRSHHAIGILLKKTLVVS
jgi:hypothetical protein